MSTLPLETRTDILTQEEFAETLDNVSDMYEYEVRKAAKETLLNSHAVLIARVRELEAMFKDGVLNLKEFHLKDGKLDASWQADPTVARMLVEDMIAFYKECNGGENYLEITLNSKESGEGFTLLIQRKGKKTPAEVNAELQQRIKALEAQLPPFPTGDTDGKN